MKPRQKTYLSGDKAQLHRAALADDVAAFTEFRQDILPFLRNAIKNGLSAEEIYKKTAALAAARGVSIAINDADSGKAMSAIKDILDRSQGKAKEQHVHVHKYSELTDEELDALLMSEAEEADASEEKQPTDSETLQ